MNENDDDTWLDALAGRTPAETPTTREAALLRSALRENVAPRALADIRPALPDLGRERALIERAVRDGLLDEVSGASSPRAKAPRSRTWLSIAAGLVLAVGAITLLQIQSPVAPEVVRGGEDGVVRLTAADPRALKQRLLSELRAAGVDATGYEALGVQGIDADLPLPLSDAVKRVLAAHHIAEPKDGALRVEIRSP